MSDRSVEAFQRYLRRLCDQAVPSEDGVLLKRFVVDNDRDAFELLIARHGPMVLGTARRLVDNSHDAEDVFQAVFLSLGRLAKTIRQGRALPSWLHKTTCRIAAKVRKNRCCRPKEPPPEFYKDVDPGAELVWQEVRRALDEELQRLPERLRAPLLLCYLSGLTRDEAARQLGWSHSTLKRRLEEGRTVLRSRLERRGIAAVGLALAVLDPKILQAALSRPQVEAMLNLICVKGRSCPRRFRRWFSVPPPH
jgi:RNA polymerase sigma factor (sigma-70 family)